MNVLRGVINQNQFAKGVVATIGNFDGVHLGHQNLIKNLKEKAAIMKLPLVVVTFEPQPREYFQRNKAPARLTSFREKVELLKRCGVDYIYCIQFNDKIAQTDAREFASKLLFSELKVKYLLVGEDFHFGKNREGTVSLLKSLGYEYSCQVDTYSDFTIEDEKVSSSKIRKALDHADFSLAAKYLGRPYSICGRVLSGDGRGRQWGIPTANLGLKRISLPLHGVFVVQVKRAGTTHSGVANLGSRPTVDGTKNILEVHLFDFNESLYGELLEVSFLHKLRGEVKFSSVDDLIAQIRMDIEAGKDFFNHESVMS